MKFGKRYSNMTVLMAMLHGVVIGIVAIVVVGLFLAGAEGKRPIEQIEEEIPASGPVGEDAEVDKNGPDALTLYAKQHGAFTTSASAATFIKENQSLSTAAVMQVEDQYFVWSAVGQTEAEIEAVLEDGTYKKEFSVAPVACEVVQSEQLWQVLKITDVAKVKNSLSENEDEKGRALAKKIDAITAFTNDLNVIRLHLLANYANESGCVKISF